MTTQPKTIQVTGLTPSATYEVWVRATNVNKSAYSVWSNKYTVKIAGDSVAPNQPSVPEVFEIPQGIRVRCNGLDSSGNPLSSDILYYEVWSGSTQIGTMPAVRPGLGLNSESTFPINAPTGSQSKTFYVYVVDKSGNKSAASATTSAKTIPTFTDAYIQNLSADKITTGTLQAGELINVGSNTGYDITLQSLSSSPWSKIYIGTGTYGNSNTAFYVDGLGKFSLGGNLTFDGAGNLSLTGDITATSGTFTGEVNASSGSISGTLTFGGALVGSSSIGTNGIELYGTKAYANGLGKAAINVIGTSRKISIDANDIQVSNTSQTYGDVLYLNRYGGAVQTGGSANSNLTVNGNLSVTGSFSISSLSLNTFTISSTTRIDNLNAQYLNSNAAGDFFKLADDETVTGTPTFQSLIGITSNTRLSGSGWRPNTSQSADLGSSTYLWRDLYRSGTTYTTSDVRLKNDIQDSDLGLDFINSLRPVKYKWNLVSSVEDSVVSTRPGVRYHYGFIAQEVQEVVGADFGGWALSDILDVDSAQMIVYEEFISPMVKSIQELSSYINNLEERLAILEGKS